MVRYTRVANYAIVTAVLGVVAASASAQCLNARCGVTANKPAGAGIGIWGGRTVPAPIVNPAPSPAPLVLGTQMLEATPFAWVRQGSGAPPSIMLPPSIFRHTANTQNLPLLRVNYNLWQLVTNFALVLPAGMSWPYAATFSVGGRTGGPSVSWCPGDPIPMASLFPTCVNNGGSGPPAHPFPGVIRYYATQHQFGGPASFARTQGHADFAIVAGFVPNCTGASCRAAFLTTHLPSPIAVGNAFGVTGTSQPYVRNTTLVVTGYTYQGRIQAGTVGTMSVSGTAAPQASYGAPWTTGVVVVTLTDSLGHHLQYTLTGGDDRVSGQGQIYLVAGGLIGVPQDDGFGYAIGITRGWLTFTVPEPTGALGTGAALLTLAVCYLLARRRSG